MKKYGLLFITALLFGLGGCVPKSTLDETQTKLADTEAKLAKAEARIAEFERRISQGREVFDDHVAENAALKKQVAEQTAQLTAQTEAMKNELLKNNLLTDEIAALKKQLAEQTEESHAQTADLQKELGAVHQQLTEAAAKLAQKPPLPVTVGFRSRLLHKGYAAKFSTTIKKDFQIIVLVKSNSSGETKTYKVNLGSQLPTELSASVFSGDELTLKHTEYTDKTVVCP